VIGRTTDLQLILDRKTVLEGRAEVAVVQMMELGQIAELLGSIREDLVLLGEIFKREVALEVILESMVIRVMSWGMMVLRGTIV
jgi:hypothetical protein